MIEIDKNNNNEISNFLIYQMDEVGHCSENEAICMDV